jgi:hypothetical protein
MNLMCVNSCLQILLHVVKDAIEQVEVQARQVGNALLASHKKEAAAGERRIREQYDIRLREKQIQLNLAQNRLQVSLHWFLDSIACKAINVHVGTQQMC